VIESNSRDRCSISAPGRGETYEAILALGLIQVLTREAIALLEGRVTEWLRPGGLLLVTAFTTDDPSFARLSAAGQRVGKTSVVDEEGSVRTFLEPGELPQLFASLENIHFREGVGPEHRHGDGPLQHHALAEAVFSLDLKSFQPG